MDVMDAILNRRSIRKYKTTPVEDEKIHAILEAGRWAPSADNRQPWHFLVVRNESTRRRLADVHDYGRFMSQSPVVIVVLGDPKRAGSYHLADPHNAVMSMLLAAHSLGLGTCWMGVRDTDIEPRFREALGIPSTLRVICAVSVGYTDSKPSSTRRPIEDVTSFEKYGLKQT